MGQKIHPHGLRIAINRKWNQSWYAKGAEWKDLFFHQKQVEYFFKAFFYLYPYTKLSSTKRILLVDLKLFKYSAKQLFLFIFFYKLRTKRRRSAKKNNFNKVKINPQSVIVESKKSKQLVLNAKLNFGKFSLYHKAYPKLNTLKK